MIRSAVVKDLKGDQSAKDHYYKRYIGPEAAQIRLETLV
jgi:hypothetical protein